MARSRGRSRTRRGSVVGYRRTYGRRASSSSGSTRRSRSGNYRTSGVTRRTGYLNIQQKDSLPFVIPSGVNFYTTELTFSINQLGNFLALARLFDQYRIARASTYFYPITNANAATNAGVTVCTSIDLDGSIAPTSFDEALQASNAKVKNFSTNGGNKPSCFVSLRPRYMNVIVKDIGPPATYSQTLGKSSAWIDIADAGDTDHRGVQISFNMPTPLNLSMQCENIITYHVEFRKVR